MKSFEKLMGDIEKVRGLADKYRPMMIVLHILLRQKQKQRIIFGIRKESQIGT